MDDTKDVSGNEDTASPDNTTHDNEAVLAEQPMSDTTVSAEETPSHETSPREEKKKPLLISIVVVLIVVALGFLFVKFGGNLSSGPQGAVVALVNGEEIREQDVEERFERLRPLFEQSGADFSNAEDLKTAREQVLSDIIGEKLLITEAQKSGVTVLDADVDAEIETIKAQVGGEEVFLAEISARGLTLEGLRSDIYNQLLIQAYIDTHVQPDQFVPSSEEIEAFYNEVVAQIGDPAPALAEVEAQISATLVQQGVQEKLASLIEELRAAADVEIIESTPVVPAPEGEVTQ